MLTCTPHYAHYAHLQHSNIPTFQGRDQELVGQEYRAAHRAAIDLMDDALMVVKRLPVAVKLSRSTIVLAPPGEWWPDSAGGTGGGGGGSVSDSSHINSSGNRNSSRNSNLIANDGKHGSSHSGRGRHSRRSTGSTSDDMDGNQPPRALHFRDLESHAHAGATGILEEVQRLQGEGEIVVLLLGKGSESESYLMLYAAVDVAVVSMQCICFPSFRSSVSLWANAEGLFGAPISCFAYADMLAGCMRWFWGFVVSFGGCGRCG